MPGAIIGGIGAMASLYGNYKQSKQQSKYARQAANMMNPEAIKRRIMALNPQLYQAAYGQGQFNPFYWYNRPTDMSTWLDNQAQASDYAARNPLAALFQAPGTLDPRLMNYSLQMNEEGANTSQQQAGQLLGRANYSGGLAAAYTMANLAAKNLGKQQIFQNYNLERESRRRSDIELGQNLLNQAQNQAYQGAAGSAQYIASQQAPPNIFQMGGQAISTGLSAYGAFKDMGGGGNRVMGNRRKDYTSVDWGSYQPPRQITPGISRFM